jgi:hypothetical protein
MRYENYDVEAKPGLGDTGARRPVRDLTEKYLAVSGYAAGSWLVQATPDGTVWVDTTITLNANGWTALPLTCDSIRLKCSSAGAVPSVQVVGRLSRSDI